MNIITLYLQLGFEHILPLGFDHILFIVALFIIKPQLKPVLIQATIFTIAHSLTLGLAAASLIYIPSSIIEPLIAVSILYVAIENIFLKNLKAPRLIFIFLFGLLHGLGFAGVLSSLGLPEREFYPALIAFNIGVELGQVAVILILWLSLKWFSKKEQYHTRVVIPLSVVIALIAIYWIIERIFFV
jgi:hypothetical protein